MSTVLVGGGGGGGGWGGGFARRDQQIAGWADGPRGITIPMRLIWNKFRIVI